MAAVGPPGQPGDINRIAHLATRFGDGYAAILDWTLEFRRVSVEGELLNLIELAGRFTSNVLREVLEYSETLHPKLLEGVEASKGGQPVKLELVLRLTFPDLLDELHTEMDRIKQLPDPT